MDNFIYHSYSTLEKIKQDFHVRWYKFLYLFRSDCRSQWYWFWDNKYCEIKGNLLDESQAQLIFYNSKNITRVEN